jgi:glyoxylase-like metal-dependent hydrolase (beta-lactamase superfamily II)
MKIHHLNAGSMRPIGVPDGFVCHVLLIETDTGLVLVDTGLGLRDIADIGPRFGPSRFLMGLALEEAETAIRQVAALGFDPKDVRDIILTHFDADHTGGLADFPWANVHLTSQEHDAVLHPKSQLEKSRYLASQRDHNPILVPHTLSPGDKWREFSSTKELSEIAPGIVLIHIPGHTRGHAGVAVNTGEHWVLHIGDCFYHHGQVDGSGNVPLALRGMEQVVAADRGQVSANHERLSALWAARQPDLVMINTHDRQLLERARNIPA